MTSRVLVTGCAGFIGSNLVDHLLTAGYTVVGIDNFNNYYDPAIKRKNISSAIKSSNFKLYEGDILNFSFLSQVFKKEKLEKVVHLAAKAGVRPSLKNPYLYGQVNVLGTVNLLNVSVGNNISQFIYGSSSSIYGQSKKLPFAEDDICQSIVSPYGSSKRAAEFFVESFHHSFGLHSTVLRFFTVYGERGRPDMAPALFTQSILKGKTISQFGNGSTSRDYTYIGDIIRGITSALEHDFDFEVINLGNSHPVKLTDFISTIEQIVGTRAKVEKSRMQMGDVNKTWANIARANKLLGWKPQVELADGLRRYFKWLQKEA